VTGSREWVSDFWDEVVAGFFAGRQPHVEDETLRLWHSAYAGVGKGEVTTLAFPEPYVGPMSPTRGEPRLVILGLNPGAADLKFQGRGGVFDREMQAFGSYAGWAASAPYLRPPWLNATRQRNKFHEDRLRFARRWTNDDAVRGEDVLAIELFPWHSVGLTAPIRPDVRLVETFVWGPLREIESPVVFAFGKDWVAVARMLGLREISVSVDFSVAMRRLNSFELPTGQRLAVVWQTSFLSVPSSYDVEAVRDALVGHPQNALRSASPVAAGNARDPSSRSIWLTKSQLSALIDLAYRGKVGQRALLGAAKAMRTPTSRKNAAELVLPVSKIKLLISAAEEGSRPPGFVDAVSPLIPALNSLALDRGTRSHAETRSVSPTRRIIRSTPGASPKRNPNTRSVPHARATSTTSASQMPPAALPGQKKASKGRNAATQDPRRKKPAGDRYDLPKSLRAQLRNDKKGRPVPTKRSVRIVSGGLPSLGKRG